jgi:hypothetical protein
MKQQELFAFQWTTNEIEIEMAIEVAVDNCVNAAANVNEIGKIWKNTLLLPPLPVPIP